MESGQAFSEDGQSVSAAYALSLLELASEQGADPRKVTRAAGVAQEALEPPSNRLPLRKMLDLFDAAQSLTGDAVIGLHMGQRVQPRTFNALGYAAMSSRTLGQAMAMIPRYEALVYDGGKTCIDEQGEFVTIRWESGLPDTCEQRALNEAIVAGWLSFGRWLTGQSGTIREVRFKHPDPEQHEAYQQFFACPVRFAATDNALCIPAMLMQLPLPQRDDELRALMESRADATVAQLHANRIVSLQVTAHIRELLPQGTPQLSVIATRMHMSERTLRRKLQTEGQSFQTLLADSRSQLAQYYLTTTRLSLFEISLLLGFAEQSSLTAAFKDWLGMTPTEYRKQQAS